MLCRALSHQVRRETLPREVLNLHGEKAVAQQSLASQPSSPSASGVSPPDKTSHQVNVTEGPHSMSWGAEESRS